MDPSLDPRELLRKLAEPFAPEDISWRVGHKMADGTSGTALAYVDARAVEDRLDAVCGCLWRCSYPHVVRSSVEGRRGSVVVCEISIKVGGEWISRCNGAGDTAVEAEKGALSDAFKRAATLWGVGRYLYGFPSPVVRIVPAGRSFKVAREEYAKLDRLSREALAEYNRDPKAFRAPPPEDEPARPGFTPTAPPARPEAPRAPAGAAPAPAGHLLTPLDAADSFESLAAAVKAGRAQEADAAFETAYADKLIAWVVGAAAKDAAMVEEVAKFASKVRPAKSEAQRFVTALDKARREARGS